MMPGPNLLLIGLLSLALGVRADLTTDLTTPTTNLTAHPACVFDDDCKDFSARAVCFIYFCVDWDEEVSMTKCSDVSVCQSGEHCREVRKTRSGKQGFCFSGKACTKHEDCSFPDEPYCMVEGGLTGGFCGPKEYYTARQQNCHQANGNFCKATLLGDHCCLDFNEENGTRCCSHPLQLVMPGEGNEEGFKRLESAMHDGDISEDNKRKICEEDEPEELVRRGLATCLEFTSTTTTTTTTTGEPSTTAPEEEVRPVHKANEKPGTRDHSGDKEDEKEDEKVMPLEGSATILSPGGSVSVIMALVSTSLLVFHL